MKKLLPALLATTALPLAASAATVINDSTWTTPVENTKAGGSSGMNYWGSAGPGGNLSINASDQLVLTQGGRAILVNFPEQKLTAVGDSLSVSFTFALSVNSGASGQLSFGVFGNTPATAITANNYGNTPAAATNYTGYLVGAAANSTSSTATIYERNATANLTASLNTTNATSLGSTGAPPSAGTNPVWTANTFYTSTLVLTRVETGLQLTYTHSASPSYTLTVIDTSSPSFDFTTVEFRGNSNLFGSGETMTISNFNVTYSPVPEPSAFAALAGLGTLGFAATRRRRR